MEQNEKVSNSAWLNQIPSRKKSKRNFASGKSIAAGNIFMVERYNIENLHEINKVMTSYWKIIIGIRLGKSGGL